MSKKNSAVVGHWTCEVKKVNKAKQAEVEAKEDNTQLNTADYIADDIDEPKHHTIVSNANFQESPHAVKVIQGSNNNQKQFFDMFGENTNDDLI